MREMPIPARIYIAFIALSGFSCLAHGLWFWQSQNPSRFLVYLALSLLCSGFKVVLPGIQANLSVNYMIFVAGFIQLSLPETLALGLASCFMQSFWHPKASPRPVQVVFNVASIAIAISGGYGFYHLNLGPLLGFGMPTPLRLVASTGAYYLLNTGSMALVVALTEQKNAARTWKESYLWSLPYYLLGGSIAGGVVLLNQQFDWRVTLLVAPMIGVIYQIFRLYLGRIEREKAHAQETASLHLRTIEALALAIEAKDDTTHEHLSRVQVYAREIGKELKLSETDLQALQAAALLHDIGKLAVPDYIISKPGKLTPEEFEKMKIHPVVGAEILESVQFPYPVAPIVRAHHEKWDGSGYPAGLEREAIPIGARIISAVDCLDALASDRQYRRALPLDKALDFVVSEAGKAFDPRIVEILRRRSVDLEKMARAESAGHEPMKLSKDVKIERGLAPDAGFEQTGVRALKAAVDASENPVEDFPARIAGARQEMQTLCEVAHDLGDSLSAHETLSMLCVRIKQLVPHDCAAIYLLQGERLKPCYVEGENSRLFSSLEVPLGQGLSGWVLENNKPIVNGNPSVEPGYLSDPTRFTTLRSALALPLRGAAGMRGVLALYALEKEAFSKEQLEILLAVAPKLAMAIESALRRQREQANGMTDSLTGLLNARALFLELDAELARSRLSGKSVSIIVLDADGFREINGRYGYNRGDEVLRALAHRMKERCRENDRLARMGGDEFAVVLPEYPRDAIERQVAVIVEAAQEAAAEVCAGMRLNASAGYASYPQDGQDAAELLATAEDRMCRIKQSRYAGALH
jgi:diguanylate cyclase (GGDEF)-like protein/putative nucleotidyltransferase with HDIG domain